MFFLNLSDNDLSSLLFSWLLASSIAKIGSDPLKFVNDAVEETSDWIYGFFSLLSDIISSEGDEEDEDADEDIDKGTQGSELYPTAMTGNWKHLTFASWRFSPNEHLGRLN